MALMQESNLPWGVRTCALSEDVSCWLPLLGGRGFALRVPYGQAAEPGMGVKQRVNIKSDKCKDLDKSSGKAGWRGKGEILRQMREEDSRMRGRHKATERGKQERIT